MPTKQPPPRRYAEGTKVPADKTRAELEQLLTRHGATEFAMREWDRRWRALLLLCRAKLELVASGHSSFEREFLSDILLPDGQTVAELLVPRIESAYRDGKMPTLLLGSGTP